MTSPRRRPLTRDSLDVERTLTRFAEIAPEIELGWSALKAEMRDLGWPARTPEGDRRKTGGWAYARCNTDGCRVVLHSQTDKDAHADATGHVHYAYAPITPSMFSGIDYADPTGEQALQLDSLHGDLIELQDEWDRVTKALKNIGRITRKHIPPASNTVPACSVTTCENTVEGTANGGYRGMERICGHWVAKPHERPLCAKHRSQERRSA